MQTRATWVTEVGFRAGGEVSAWELALTCNKV